MIERNKTKEQLYAETVTKLLATKGDE